MKSFIKERVVKNYNVELSAPCMVQCDEEFQELEAYLAVLKTENQETAKHSFSSLQTDTSESEAEAQRESGQESEYLIAEAKTRAQEILAQADKQAQEILAKADKQAQEMRIQVQKDLDRLREEARTAARSEGYQVGFEAGEAEGKKITENARRLFQLLEGAFQEEYAKVDKDLLHLALKIAERILRSSLAVTPQRLMKIIQALTLLPEKRTGWKLHVSEEDALWLKKLPDENRLPCPWMMDKSLHAGDCFLECEEGIFDARLEVQLEKLEYILREELEHGGLESIDADSGTE